MVVCAIALPQELQNSAAEPRGPEGGASRSAIRLSLCGLLLGNTFAVQIDVLNQFSRESRGVFGRRVSMLPMELMGLDTALSDTRPRRISVVHVLHIVRRVCTIDASEIGP